jgi:hypothetical protein
VCGLRPSCLHEAATQSAGGEVGNDEEEKSTANNGWRDNILLVLCFLLRLIDSGSVNENSQIRQFSKPIKKQNISLVTSVTTPPTLSQVHHFLKSEIDVRATKSPQYKAWRDFRKNIECVKSSAEPINRPGNFRNGWHPTFRSTGV